MFLEQCISVALRPSDYISYDIVVVGHVFLDMLVKIRHTKPMTQIMEISGDMRQM
jgi:hypothetical protein